MTVHYTSEATAAAERQSTDRNRRQYRQRAIISADGGMHLATL